MKAPSVRTTWRILLVLALLVLAGRMVHWYTHRDAFGRSGGIGSTTSGVDLAYSVATRGPDRRGTEAFPMDIQVRVR